MLGECGIPIVQVIALGSRFLGTLQCVVFPWNRVIIGAVAHICVLWITIKQCYCTYGSCYLEYVVF